MHDLSRDLHALLPLSDGRMLSGPDIQRALQDRLVPASDFLEDDEDGEVAQGLLDVFALWREIG